MTRDYVDERLLSMSEENEIEIGSESRSKLFLFLFFQYFGVKILKAKAGGE